MDAASSQSPPFDHPALVTAPGVVRIGSVAAEGGRAPGDGVAARAPVILGDTTAAPPWTVQRRVNVVSTRAFAVVTFDCSVHTLHKYTIHNAIRTEFIQLRASLKIRKSLTAPRREVWGRELSAFEILHNLTSNY